MMMLDTISTNHLARGESFKVLFNFSIALSFESSNVQSFHFYQNVSVLKPTFRSFQFFLLLLKTKNMHKLQHFLLILIFLWNGGVSARAQISKGGTPWSFDIQISTPPAIVVEKPDLEALKQQDLQQTGNRKPYRFAKNIPVRKDFSTLASWQKTRKGWIGRLAIKAPDARAMVLFYERFELPENSSFFVYSPGYQQVIGALDKDNNPGHGSFATGMIKGTTTILEYNYSGTALVKPNIRIAEAGYVYRGDSYILKGFGDSGACEINVNCSEGDDWQSQKNGVVRIIIKKGMDAYYCSGSLVNNTSEDLTPYILTADHCGDGATSTDLEQWLFYFNYEAAGCDDPAVEPALQSMTGASLMARSGTSGYSGSDFFLTKLEQYVPSSYNPYYIGWSRSTTAATSGVCIHHPYGDIKKISTFYEPLVPASYGVATITAHWRVHWAETEHGQGVTEGGSSGSPLFNSNGLLVGTLTGGGASCENPDEPDYFGMFSYSWDKNGDVPEKRLSDWLDPQETGAVVWPGLGDNIDFVLANFTVVGDTTVVKGEAVDFFDMSAGPVETWHWIFEGGNPETVSVQHPTGIVYNNFGSYDVTLIAGGADKTDTIIRNDLIKVMANTYPVPVNERFTLDFGADKTGSVNVTTYNSRGNKIFSTTQTLVEGKMEIVSSSWPAGLYVVRAGLDGNESEYKIMKIRTK
jgi:hypothetical protein